MGFLLRHALEDDKLVLNGQNNPFFLANDDYLFIITDTVATLTSIFLKLTHLAASGALMLNIGCCLPIMLVKFNLGNYLSNSIIYC